MSGFALRLEPDLNIIDTMAKKIRFQENENGGGK